MWIILQPFLQVMHLSSALVTVEAEKNFFKDVVEEHEVVEVSNDDRSLFGPVVPSRPEQLKQNPLNLMNTDSVSSKKSHYQTDWFFLRHTTRVNL